MKLSDCSSVCGKIRRTIIQQLSNWQLSNWEEKWIPGLTPGMTDKQRVRWLKSWRVSGLTLSAVEGLKGG